MTTIHLRSSSAPATRARPRRADPHRIRCSAAPADAPPLPARRLDLIVRPFGDDGASVIKDPNGGAYYTLGPQEAFLFDQLDGHQPANAVREAFARRFGEPLTAEDLSGFLELARESAFLAEAASPASATTPSPPAGRSAADRFGSSGQSILYWRRSVLNPDRLLTVLEPPLRFLWTRAFVMLSAALIGGALLIVWMNAHELVTRFPHMIRWETAVLAWLTLITATALHEFAHGLTCKHFGGEVREVGFLMMFFIPCLYCNVSDAWLFREKSKRLWVTLAGGYFDLLAWGVAAWVWRLSAQDSIINYLAWVILSVLGVRNLFNFNPLLKLDGYYLLSDACAIPNLRQRGWDRFMAGARWMLWGAPRPAPQPRDRFLLVFGTAAWCYSLLLLSLIIAGFLWLFRDRWGHAGTAAALVLGVTVSRSAFEGMSNGEFRTMITTRHRRTVAWLITLIVLCAILALVKIDERAPGSFHAKSTTRADLRAPVAGFLASTHYEQGDYIPRDAAVAQLYIPDLETRLVQKRAAVAETQARIRMLQAAPAGAAGAGGTSEEPAGESVRRLAEIDAERARLVQIEADVQHLQSQQQRLIVRTPVAGLLLTPHLHDRVGEHLNAGDLICQVADPSVLDIEILVDEQEAAEARVGQPVMLKARSLPYDRFYARVERVAPAAVEGDVQSKVILYCTLINPSTSLRPGMSGHARISYGRRPVGRVMFGRIVRTFRTEFWW